MYKRRHSIRRIRVIKRILAVCVCIFVMIGICGCHLSKPKPPKEKEVVEKVREMINEDITITFLWIDEWSGKKEYNETSSKTVIEEFCHDVIEKSGRIDYLINFQRIVVSSIYRHQGIA